MNTTQFPASLLSSFHPVFSKDGSIDVKATVKDISTKLEAYVEIRSTGAKTVASALNAVYKDNGSRPMEKSYLKMLVAARMGVNGSNVEAINETLDEHLPNLIVSDRSGSRPGTPDEVAKSQAAIAARTAKSQATRAANKSSQPAS